MSRRYAAVAALVAVVVVVLAVVLLTSKGSSSSSQSPQASANASAPAQSAAGATPASSAKAAPVTVPLSGGSFTTAYPKGYRLTVKHAQGAARYQLSSTGAAVNSVEIPPARTIAVTIDETPTSLFRRLHLAGAQPDTSAATQTPVQLMPNFVGTPARAEDVAHASPVHATTLGGAPAAEESYAYRFDGRENVQVDVLARHGTRVLNIELDAEPALAAASQAALESITGRWRWR